MEIRPARLLSCPIGSLTLSLKSLLLILTLIGVSGCGFQPLYQRSGSDTGIAAELAKVEIGPFEDNEDPLNARLEQMARNALLDTLQPRGKSSTPTYFLRIRITEKVRRLSVQEDSFATRANLILNASYSLVDLKSGTEITFDISKIITGFNILLSEFATLQNENGAREKAVRRLALDIRQKVAVALHQRKLRGR